ncbi:hypothetical protein Q5752_006417 [Cryptotrichosporon argae]
MSVKRELSPTPSSPSFDRLSDSADEFKPSPSPSPRTPKKAKTGSTALTPSTPKTPKTPGAGTPKGSKVAPDAKRAFAEMIVDAGIRALNANDVQAKTGLTQAQQKEMTRKDKGSLRRALLAAIAGL